MEIEHAPTFQVLNEAFCILSANWLENRNTNITQELSRIFKAFSDFRLVAQIREEIEKVKTFEQIVIT